MLSIAALLPLVMDLFGNLVVVHSLLEGRGYAARLLVIGREALIATALLVAAACFGQVLLDLLELEQHAICLAGGIVLFLIALAMISPTKKILEEQSGEAPFIVPIAVPLLAGPSAISMAILFAEKHPRLTVIQGVVLAASINAVILSLAPVSFLDARMPG